MKESKVLWIASSVKTVDHGVLLGLARARPVHNFEELTKTENNIKRMIIQLLQLFTVLNFHILLDLAVAEANFQWHEKIVKLCFLYSYIGIEIEE